LVLEHRLSFDEAVETAVDLTYHLPKQSYPAPTGRTVRTASDASRSGPQ
jgi:glucuronate isomerase